jgi:hypothetical protein
MVVGYAATRQQVRSSNFPVQVIVSTSSKDVFFNSFCSSCVFPVDCDILCQMVMNLVAAPVQEVGQAQYKKIKPQEEEFSTKGP